jgi:putative endonuclease
MQKQYFVYIMTNVHNTVLYTGITNNLRKRVREHRNGYGGDFTSRYRIVKLVYYEIWSKAWQAIAREKQIKAGSRRKKIELIEAMNPAWKDLRPTLGSLLQIASPRLSGARNDA